MLKNKQYVNLLLIIISMILTTSIGYAYYFSKHYPLPFTSRISLDAKIQFVRDHIDVNKIDTVIVGSSIGLNNIQGTYLERESRQCNGVLNLSVYEASALQVERLLELIDIFPNLKRVIYSMQFSDFSHLSTFRTFDVNKIKAYMSHTMNPVATAAFIAKASSDIPFLQKRKADWEKKHGQSNRFTYLGFDRTGSVPLHIYGEDIILKRWNEPHATVQRPEAFEALRRMIKSVRTKKIAFYLVQQPYRQALIDKDKVLKGFMQRFPKNINLLTQQSGGIFFSLHQELHLVDDYFADRSHLNDKGSIVTAKALAKFIDKVEQN